MIMMMMMMMMISVAAVGRCVPLRITNVSGSSLTITATANIKRQCAVYTDSACTCEVQNVYLAMNVSTTYFVQLTPILSSEAIAAGACRDIVGGIRFFGSSATASPTTTPTKTTTTTATATATATAVVGEKDVAVQEADGSEHNNNNNNNKSSSKSNSQARGNEPIPHFEFTVKFAGVVGHSILRLVPERRDPYCCTRFVPTTTTTTTTTTTVAAIAAAAAEAVIAIAATTAAGQATKPRTTATTATTATTTAEAITTATAEGKESVSALAVVHGRFDMVNVAKVLYCVPNLCGEALQFCLFVCLCFGCD